MTTILPSARSGLDVVGSQIGANLHQVLPGAVQQGYNRGQLLQGLDKLRSLSQQQGVSPMEMLIQGMEAGAGIPGSERYLGAVLPELMKFAQAKKSQDIGLPGEQRDRSPVEMPPPRPEAPSFANLQQNQPNQNFPTNIGPQGQVGNLPQEATTGVKIPIPSPKDMIQEGRRLAEDSTKNGVPMTAREGYDQVKNYYDDAKLHNVEVDAEREQRKKAQRDYGNLAVEELHKVYEKSTPEMDSIFKKKAEEKAGKGESEAEIEKYIATEAKNLANTITNIEKDLSAPRLQNKLQRSFLQSDKDFNQSAADLRTKIKPLLDLGLYDTARNLLSGLGYYPEERETIINPMSERQKTMMNQVPETQKKFKEKGRFGHEFVYSPQDKENIKEGLVNLKKTDPNFSLVLARKAFEDKGYDWRLFKDSLNELSEMGFILEDDQKNQLLHLDTPPLNLLEKALQGVGIIGR